MKTTVEIARRGQITIPKSLRDELGIAEGQRYDLRALDGGVLLLTPRPGRANAALNQLREMLLAENASLPPMQAEIRRMRELAP